MFLLYMSENVSKRKKKKSEKRKHWLQNVRSNLSSCYVNIFQSLWLVLQNLFLVAKRKFTHIICKKRAKLTRIYHVDRFSMVQMCKNQLLSIKIHKILFENTYFFEQERVIYVKEVLYWRKNYWVTWRIPQSLIFSLTLFNFLSSRVAGNLALLKISAVALVIY